MPTYQSGVTSTTHYWPSKGMCEKMPYLERRHRTLFAYVASMFTTFIRRHCRVNDSDAKNDSLGLQLAVYDVDALLDVVRSYDEEALKFISLHRTDF
jgi:hypothetical protein